MKYIDADKLINMIDNSIAYCQINYSDDYAFGFEHSLREVKNFIVSLQQEQLKKRLIQVKCLYPYDESWQKNKVYTCEVWHHGDLNHDFWDVYYDYGKDPRYVQFSSIRRLNEEFAIIQEESQVILEQPEVDLEEEIVSICKTYGITKHLDAELGPLEIKNIAHHFYELGLKARKEE